MIFPGVLSVFKVFQEMWEPWQFKKKIQILCHMGDLNIETIFAIQNCQKPQFWNAWLFNFPQNDKPGLAVMNPSKESLVYSTKM